MYIDPGEEMQALWMREIIEKNEPLAMWDFFTNALVSLLDEGSIQHLIRHQGHIVRMHFYFALMSVLPTSMGDSKKYIVGVNNEEYLLRNLTCIQSVNQSLTFERHEDTVHVRPLNIIFRVGEFSDSKTYQIPLFLGGSRYAYEIFADDCDFYNE